MIRPVVATLLACILLVPLSSADDPKPAKPKAAADQWTVDDVLSTEAASDFRIAPDGRHVVWVKHVPDEDAGQRVGNLMRSSFTADETVELTHGSDDCLSPRWSPDGKRIAFLTARTPPKAKQVRGRHARPRAKDDDDTKTQVWLMNAFGGEPKPLTELKREVKAFEWADDDHLLFLAQEEPSLHETTADDNDDKTTVADDEPHEPPVRLFRVAVETKKVTRLTDNADRITALAVAPGGRHVVTVHERSLRYTYDNKIKPVVYLYDLTTGHRRQVFADPKLNPRDPKWALDGKGFYAANDHTSDPRYLQAYITELYYHDLATGREAKVPLDWENGLAAELEDNDAQTGYQVTADGFVALLANGVRNKAARYVRSGDGWRREWLTGEHADRIFALAGDRDGRRLVYAHSSATTPTQWYRCRLTGGRLGKPQVLTDLNEHLADKPKARVEVVRWKGARDEEVEGLLYYPHHYREGKKHPLVVMIHGGPAGVDQDVWDDSWAYPMNLMAQRGAFVLRPNYHGSTNYGLAFVESIAHGKYYDLEVPDIEKGVDALIARGLVDPDQLGVLGWSNGAILTIALTVTTPRYKVASAGAGDVDWASDWGNCEFGAAFDNYYLGKTPLEDPQLYIKKSPFYRLNQVRTPTLIFFGTDDRQVPTQQGWMHYRALQQLGKADVRFLLFPGEEHSPTKLVHQRRKLQEELDWFDKYLFGTLKPANEAVKPDSPLARLLQLKEVKKDGGRYGVVVKGQLVPEIVTHEGLEVGRFEVTRAQFAQFDKTYVVEPGKENYPASGVTAEQARAYCAWLSGLTGTTFRLPTEAEAETLYEATEAHENTLDTWAGYAVNPDDAARLREKLKELGDGALVRAVGSFLGTGGANPVYDLGGNVAEWVEGKDGKARPAGGSADTAADARLKERQPAAVYIGLRVVKGKAE